MIGDGVDPKAEELAVLVERQLGMGDVVAAMGVGQEGFAALGRPFDRPAELARGPGAARLLGIGKIFEPKPPPTSGATTRSLCSGMPSTKARQEQPQRRAGSATW